MRFLIDECLHFTLIERANKAGFEATHVNWRNLAGTSDRALMDTIVDGDFTFVTNNAKDFKRLYAREPLHAGLVIVVPCVAPREQRRLFEAVLRKLDAEDQLVNEVIEVRFDGDEIGLHRYPLPDN